MKDFLLVDWREEDAFNSISKIIPIEKRSSIISTERYGAVKSVFGLPKYYNQLIRKSDYYLEPIPFLHFTSIGSLESIIRSRCLRLYNLNRSSDSGEYSYIADKYAEILRIQGLNEKAIEKRIQVRKEYLFYSSFTYKENLESNYHWSEYGRNKQGVAIEFEFLNSYETWRYCYFLKIFYQDDSRFDELANEWKSIQELYKNENHIIDLDIDSLFAINKTQRYLKEKEIRLLFSGIDIQRTHPLFGDKFIHKEEENPSVKFFTLPLSNANGQFLTDIDDAKIWKWLPKIKIVDIHFHKDNLIDCELQKELKNKILLMNSSSSPAPL